MDEWSISRSFERESWVIFINYYFHYVTCHQFNNAIRPNEVDSMNDVLSILRIIKTQYNFRSAGPFDHHGNRSLSSCRRRAVHQTRNSMSRIAGKRTPVKIARRLLANSRLVGQQATRKQWGEDPCRISLTGPPPFSARRFPVLSLGRNEVSITSHGCL